MEREDPGEKPMLLQATSRTMKRNTPGCRKVHRWQDCTRLARRVDVCEHIGFLEVALSTLLHNQP
jgi:hypothetical protein